MMERGGASVHTPLMCACPQHTCKAPASIPFVYLFMLLTCFTEDLRALARIFKSREEPINWG